eukprot:243204-Prorocentrum_minimum.AAC.1
MLEWPPRRQFVELRRRCNPCVSHSRAAKGVGAYGAYGAGQPQHQDASCAPRTLHAHCEGPPPPRRREVSAAPREPLRDPLTPLPTTP